MAQKLLEVLKISRCSHEFSWPRRAADGDYYQVCLLCAVQYRYDWNAMRRIERVEPGIAKSAETKTARGAKTKPTWVPRARRIKLQTPVRYRVKNLGTWYEGVIENLSQSGVLVRGAQHFPDNTLVEMVFEMPEEISGQKNSSVLCQARLIRGKESSHPDVKDMAFSILDYKFLHQN